MQRRRFWYWRKMARRWEVWGALMLLSAGVVGFTLFSAPLMLLAGAVGSIVTLYWAHCEAVTKPVTKPSPTPRRFEVIEGGRRDA